VTEEQALEKLEEIVEQNLGDTDIIHKEATAILLECLDGYAPKLSARFREIAEKAAFGYYL